MQKKDKVKNIKSGKITTELQAIASLTEEALKAFQNNSEFDKIGRLLDKSWQFKRRLAKGVSANWMDEIYNTAIRNGAFGGKLMGAGGGGFFICWAPKNKHNEIKNRLKIKTWVNVKFSLSGSQIIFSE